jgi:hypothetical protein
MWCTRLDPDTFAARAGSVNVQNNLDVRPMLVDVLNEIGELPEDATRLAIEARRGREREIDVTPDADIGDDDVRQAIEARRQDEGDNEQP